METFAPRLALTCLASPGLALRGLCWFLWFSVSLCLALLRFEPETQQQTNPVSSFK